MFGYILMYSCIYFINLSESPMQKGQILYKYR